ncbi:hypothetical protein RHMOL_Rhmol04G0073000 [Rhododendron molle]|uniref:Uncharacterized protein n=1 Tax=Rhododendron molle TaxID=49168 RepID=A0ACC0NXW9_RHOML|nr:hypothetical protein RHMOL_Rhmol04G0073000 [Rhododendron molle]
MNHPHMAKGTATTRSASRSSSTSRPTAAEARATTTARNGLISEEDGDDAIVFGCKQIGLEEFADFAARDGGGKSNNNSKEIGDAFEMYDRDRNGTISVDRAGLG